MEITKGLLLHWWHYYGKELYTLAELEKFEEIIDKYGADKIFEVAVASYITHDGSPTIMLSSIRNNNVEELFAVLPDISKFSSDKLETYNIIKNDLLSQISSTM